MARTSLGTLYVDLMAKTAGFETDLGRAAKIAERKAKEIDKAISDAGKAIGAGLATAAAAAAVSIGRAVNQMDEMGKTAQKIGVSVSALSELQYAAKLSDVSIEQLQSGMVRLAKAQADAASGAEAQRRVFDALGVAYQDVNGQLRNTDDVFRDVAQRFSEMQDGADKTALAVELFGRSGADLIPLLNSGADGLAAMAEEARNLGIVISDQGAAAAEQFNDNLTRLGSVIDGVGIRVAEQLLPAMNELVDTIVSAANDPAFTQNLAAGIEGIGRAVVFTVEAIAGGIGYVREFAEWIAKITGGEALTDLASVNEQLSTINSQINALQVGKRTEESEARLQALYKEAEQLRNLQSLYQDIEKPAGQAPAAPAAPKSARTAPRIYSSRSTTATPRAARPEVDRSAERMAKIDADIQREIESENRRRMEEQKRLFEEVQRIKLDSMSEEQQAVIRLQTEYTKLQTAVQKGLISQEEAAQISAGLATQWADRQEEAVQKTDELSEFTKAAAQNMQSAFADFLFDPFSDGLDGMLMGFLETIRRMAAEALAAQIFKGIANWGTANAGGGGALGMIAGLASNFAGGKDAGGSIPSGMWGIAGERGPEIVGGPATVIGRANTSNMLANSGGGNNVRIVNAIDPRFVGDYLGSSDGERAILNVVSRNSRRMRSVMG